TGGAGDVNFHNSTDLVIGSVAINGVTTSGATASGALNIDTPGALRVDNSLQSNTSIFLHSGTDGTGDMTFGGGVTVGSPDITLQAGDGTGGAGTDAKIVTAITD